MKKKLFFGVIILGIIISICSFTSKVEANTLYGYGWKTLPIRIYAGSDLNANERSQLIEAINAWNSTRFGTFFEYAGVRSSHLIPVYTMRDGYNTVSKAPIGINTGGTYLFGTTSEITEVNVVINSNYTYNYGGASVGDYYLKSVLMHELGHVLGLNDEENPNIGSIMYKGYTGSTTITAYDLSDLDTLY
ncbi:MAG: matrixin family metalloprotease [Clostridia bacterium]|nr:matrixin family metalloprotease [Clostridia bacterium]